MFENLLVWYDKNKRDLPWRRTKDPYRIWLSEIMLQQTRVEAVKGYYTRFLSVFPDIPSLSAGEEEVFLKLWEGLGYYTRVRNLHRGARRIMEEYGGSMPETSRELLSIEGIGEYTAAAIASIAFGEAVPTIDGNLLRIFARLTAYPENIKSGRAKKAAYGFWLEHMDRERPGDFNEALMDLGSSVCTPKNPDCGVCPLERGCGAASLGMQQAYPNIPKKKARSVEERTIFLIHDGHRVLLQKRREEGLLAGLFEFPGAEGALGPSEALSWLEERGIFPVSLHAIKETKHVFSHREWHMTGYNVRLPKPDALRERSIGEQTKYPGGSRLMEEFFFADFEELIHTYSIPSAFRPYRELLLAESLSPSHREADGNENP